MLERPGQNPLVHSPITRSRRRSARAGAQSAADHPGRRRCLAPAPRAGRGAASSRWRSAAAGLKASIPNVFTLQATLPEGGVARALRGGAGCASSSALVRDGVTEPELQRAKNMVGGGFLARRLDHRRQGAPARRVRGDARRSPAAVRRARSLRARHARGRAASMARAGVRPASGAPSAILKPRSSCTRATRSISRQRRRSPSGASAPARSPTACG